MSNELILFKKGIKPAILFPDNVKEKVDLNLNAYYTTTFRKSIILSHTELPCITDRDNIKLGIVLGYYPKSCEVLYSNREVWTENEFINFGGIQFNTAHLFDEAFEWCIETYKDKMLKSYDNIVIHRWKNKRVNNKVLKLLLETKIIKR